MLTIEPRPARPIGPATAFMPRKTPSVFTSHWPRNRSSLMLTIGSWTAVPALFTRMSTAPNASSAVATTRAQSSADRTSCRTNTASPPIPAATLAPPSSTSVTTTRAPSRARVRA